MQATAADTWCFEYTITARDGADVDRVRSDAMRAALNEWVETQDLVIEGGGALPFGTDALPEWSVMIWLQAADKTSPVARAKAGEMWKHILELAKADGLKIEGTYTPPPFRTEERRRLHVVRGRCDLRGGLRRRPRRSGAHRPRGD